MTDKKRKQQNSHCCQLPLFLPRVCKLVVLRKLKINGIDLSTLLIAPSLLQLDFAQISAAPKLFCHSSCSCKNANLSSESRIYCAKFPHSIYDQKYFIKNVWIFSNSIPMCCQINSEKKTHNSEL